MAKVKKVKKYRKKKNTWLWNGVWLIPGNIVVVQNNYDEYISFYKAVPEENRIIKSIWVKNKVLKTLEYKIVDEKEKYN